MNFDRVINKPMLYKKTNQKYIVKLTKGEKVLEELTKFCESEGIKSGVLRAIGAIRGAELGYYDLDNKKYLYKKMDGDFEIASLIGNITNLNGKIFIHAHIVLSDSNFQCHGGHLKEADVGAVCEVFLEPLEDEVTRKMDEEIGLNLMDI